MKNQIVLIVLLILIFCFEGCFSKDPAIGNGHGHDIHNSRNSLDWEGTYYGIVPCADCPGIETYITLKSDHSYILRTRYLEKDDKIFERQGDFVWGESGNIIHFQDSFYGPAHYQVGENKLFQLDMQGQRISGDLANNYILRKISSREKSL